MRFVASAACSKTVVVSSSRVGRGSLPSGRRTTRGSRSSSVRMLGSLFDALTGKGGADTPKVSATNIYELPDGTDVDGNPFEYKSLKGKVVLITNVASR